MFETINDEGAGRFGENLPPAALALMFRHVRRERRVEPLGPIEIATLIVVARCGRTLAELIVEVPENLGWKFQEIV